MFKKLNGGGPGDIHPTCAGLDICGHDSCSSDHCYIDLCWSSDVCTEGDKHCHWLD